MTESPVEEQNLLSPVLLAETCSAVLRHVIEGEQRSGVLHHTVILLGDGDEQRLEKSANDMRPGRELAEKQD